MMGDICWHIINYSEFVHRSIVNILYWLFIHQSCFELLKDTKIRVFSNITQPVNSGLVRQYGLNTL